MALLILIILLGAKHFVTAEGRSLVGAMLVYKQGDTYEENIYCDVFGV